jgi:hypothetical protein
MAEIHNFEGLETLLAHILSNEDHLLPRPRALRRICYALAESQEHAAVLVGESTTNPWVLKIVDGA